MATLTAPARMGPNAIIQVAGVLGDRVGPAIAEAVLHDTTGYRMDALPSRMVDEREAQALVRGLVDRIGPDEATGVLHDAGVRTADYLLAVRIPRVAQLVIRSLPRRIGLGLLLRLMSANAWTFAGSGRFLVVPGRPWPELRFENCAMCRHMHEHQPMCDFYGGTFERLIRVLVASEAQVDEVECLAQGGSACRFRLHGL